MSGLYILLSVVAFGIIDRCFFFFLPPLVFRKCRWTGIYLLTLNNHPNPASSEILKHFHIITKLCLTSSEDQVTLITEVLLRSQGRKQLERPISKYSSMTAVLQQTSVHIMVINFNIKVFRAHCAVSILFSERIL